MGDLKKATRAEFDGTWLTIDFPKDNKHALKLTFPDDDTQTIVQTLEGWEKIVQYVRSGGDALAQIQKQINGTVQVMTDIDDTLIPHGWHTVSNSIYPLKEPYPGMPEFLVALSKTALDVQPLSTMLLSARAGDNKALGRAFRINPRNHPITIGLETAGGSLGKILYGKLKELLSNPKKAMRKYTNLKRYAQIRPHQSYIFVGDDGEGDLKAGLDMLSDDKCYMKAVFIHKVSDIYSRNSEHAYKVDHRYPEKMFFYNTAAGAAYQALRAGLISRESAEAVISKVQEFYERNRSSACNPLQQRELDQIHCDLGVANHEKLLA